MRRARRKLGRESSKLTRPGGATDRIPRKPRGQSDPIPDLWEVPGTKLPGNPKFTDHEPEYTYLIDVRGDRVCVVKSKITQFRARSVGIEKLHKVRRPQKVPTLWNGARHHVLTHALRLLQVNSMTFEGQHRVREERQLRGNIQPRQLLEGCGASRALADSLLKQLVEADLLRSQVGKSGTCWFVNTRIRGFGPNMQRFSNSQLGDSCVLPEFSDSARVLEIEAATTPEEVEEVMIQPDPSKKRVKRTDSQHLATLNSALSVIRGLASTKDWPKDEDGFIVFDFPGSLQSLLSNELGCSDNQARRILDELKWLGLTESVRATGVGRGMSRRRLNFAGAITLADVRRLREYNAAEVAGYKAASGKKDEVKADGPPPEAEPPASPPEEKGQVTDMDSFMAMVRQRFEDYEERVSALKLALAQRDDEIAQLKAELDSRPPTAQVVIPDDLAKYLDNN